MLALNFTVASSVSLKSLSASRPTYDAVLFFHGINGLELACESGRVSRRFGSWEVESVWKLRLNGWQAGRNIGRAIGRPRLPRIPFHTQTSLPPFSPGETWDLHPLQWCIAPPGGCPRRYLK